MKKSQLAKALVEASLIEEINFKTVESLTQVIETAFSALGTANPGIAIDVLDQLYQQRPMIVEFKRQRKEDQRMNAKLVGSNLPAIFDEEN